MNAAGSTLFHLRGLSKAFPPSVQALRGVDLELRAGEVHALIGENGAGKSTLSRILAGVEAPDSGGMMLKGQSYAPRSRAAAERAGVRLVMQELNLISTLTVAENLFLGRLPRRFGFINRPRLRRQAAEALSAVGLDRLDPETPVEALGIGEQQMVEIAAGLWKHCDVLILDEPTAALTDTEAERLFQRIAELKTAGVAIVYISHRMPEIARLADRSTILRDGRVVGTCGREDFSLPRVIRLMVGREVEAAVPRRSPPSPDLALKVVGLRGGPRVREVGFELRRGEILGFAGLMGSGRTETMRLIFGADPKDGGDLYLNGSATPSELRSPQEAVSAGIALLTEDRKSQGLLLPWSVRRNISLPSLARGRSWDGEARDAEDLTRMLDIRCSSIEQPVGELSGGNQQKVVIAKWLLRDAGIFIVDEPTRGIDVGAKAEIHRLLLGLAERGKSILIVSSDLPELMALCHRIAVLSAGRLVRTFEGPGYDADALLAAALPSVGARP